MRKLIFLGFFIASMSAASAAECTFVSDGGYVARVIDPMTIEVTGPAGEKDTCETFGGGTGVAVRGVHCGNGYEGAVFFAPAQLGGDDADLLIFQNAVWYRQCE